MTSISIYSSNVFCFKSPKVSLKRATTQVVHEYGPEKLNGKMSIFFGYFISNLGIFLVLKIMTWVFFRVFQKKFDKLTYHFHIKSAPSRIKSCFSSLIAQKCKYACFVLEFFNWAGIYVLWALCPFGAWLDHRFSLLFCCFFCFGNKQLALQVWLFWTTEYFAQARHSLIFPISSTSIRSQSRF